MALCSITPGRFPLCVQMHTAGPREIARLQRPTLAQALLTPGSTWTKLHQHACRLWDTGRALTRRCRALAGDSRNFMVNLYTNDNQEPFAAPRIGCGKRRRTLPTPGEAGDKRQNWERMWQKLTWNKPGSGQALGSAWPAYGRNPGNIQAGSGQSLAWLWIGSGEGSGRLWTEFGQVPRKTWAQLRLLPAGIEAGRGQPMGTLKAEVVPCCPVANRIQPRANRKAARKFCLTAAVQPRTRADCEDFLLLLSCSSGFGCAAPHLCEPSRLCGVDSGSTRNPLDCSVGCASRQECLLYVRSLGLSGRAFWSAQPPATPPVRQPMTSVAALPRCFRPACGSRSGKAPGCLPLSRPCRGGMPIAAGCQACLAQALAGVTMGAGGQILRCALGHEAAA
jgi:hypothetical protein